MIIIDNNCFTIGSRNLFTPSRRQEPDLAGTLWAGAAHKAHDPPPVVGVAGLQQPDRDAERHPGGAQRSLPRGHRPGVALQLTQQVRQRHVALVHRLQEAVGGREGLATTQTAGLLLLAGWSAGGHGARGAALANPQHILDLDRENKFSKYSTSWK